MADETRSTPVPTETSPEALAAMDPALATAVVAIEAAARKPKRQPKAPVTVEAQLARMDEKLNALITLVASQAELITQLMARPPAAAPTGPSAPQGPAGLKTVGQRGASYACPCLGPDGKAHGTVTINRFGNCPTCYNAAHFSAQRKAA